MYRLRMRGIVSRSFYYTILAKRVLKSYGEGLRVNHRCQLTRSTIVGHHCNFNGMTIAGGRNVTIGDYFHSGVECMIITQNHNYEGNEIPYDSTYVLNTTDALIITKIL